MRAEVLLALAVVVATVASGCSKLERLSIIRPSAHSRGYTQVAPHYDVRGKPGERGGGDPALLVAAAVDQFERGALDDAQRLADAALKAGPGDRGGAQTVLAMVADARGQHANAGKLYLAAATGSAVDGRYLNNYGIWLCRNGKPGDSLEWFERAVAAPDYATPVQAMVNAGECARSAGQPLRAEVQWRSALAIEPENPGALAGMAMLEHGNGRWMEARAFVERWLALAPDDADALRLGADIEQKLGDNAASSRYRSRLQAIPAGSTSVPRKP